MKHSLFKDDRFSAEKNRLTALSRKPRCSQRKGGGIILAFTLFGASTLALLSIGCGKGEAVSTDSKSVETGAEQISATAGRTDESESEFQKVPASFNTSEFAASWGALVGWTFGEDEVSEAADSLLKILKTIGEGGELTEVIAGSDELIAALKSDGQEDNVNLVEVIRNAAVEANANR